MSSNMFSAAERHILQRLGEAVCPETAVLPAFDAAAVERIERYFSDFDDARATLVGLRAMLRLIEAQALGHHLRPMSRLPLARRIAYLERCWLDAPSRWRSRAFRLLAGVVKVAYLNDDRLFAALGSEFHKPPVAVQDPPRWQRQVVHGRELDAAQPLEAEVVVVGTGAGGAVAAYELARRGNAVLMVEAGDLFTRTQFTGRPFEMQRLMYARRGITLALGNAGVVVPYGVTVGGTTTINSGTCFRAPARTLRRWRDEHGLGDYTPAAMEPYFRRVEEIYGVAPADMRHVGANGRIAARGAGALGYHHGPLLRNAPDCDAQSSCCYGCPTDAKRSTNVSFVPKALEAGAQLLCRVRAEEVLLKGGAVRGLRARCLDSGRELRIDAPCVVLAAGAFGTPQLLLRQKICNSSHQLGRNLSLHPATLVYALMPEEVRPDRCIPQGYVIDEFEEEGILLEGITLPLDMLALTVDRIGYHGQHLVERYPHMAFYSPIICDTSRGRVVAGRGRQPLIFYQLNRRDLGQLLRGAGILTRVFLAAGAQQVHATVRGWRPMRQARHLEANLARRTAALDVDLSAYHPLGTCHMSGFRRRSVCSPEGETYDVRNLFVADGSVIPPALGVNPMITISAVAARIAEGVHQRLQAL